MTSDTDYRRLHPDWTANYAEGQRAFAEGVTDRAALQERHRQTASGHIVLRTDAWFCGYVEAAMHAAAPDPHFRFYLPAKASEPEAA